MSDHTLDVLLDRSRDLDLPMILTRMADWSGPTLHTFWFRNCARAVCLCSAKASHQSIWNKLDGRVDAERYYAVLRLRAGATESTLPQHVILKGQQLLAWIFYMAFVPVGWVTCCTPSVCAHACHLGKVGWCDPSFGEQKVWMMDCYHLILLLCSSMAKWY